jgi:hypothetical protein
MKRMLTVITAALGLASLWLATAPAAMPADAHPARGQRPPVVVIVMENHEYTSIVGSSSAPYLNHSFIPHGVLFTRYHALHHPSLPNYLAMTSGQTSGCGSDGCPKKTYRTNNIFHQLSASEISWVAWQESMPTRCASSSSGSYAAWHNPPLYYANLFPRICRYRDVRYPSRLPRHLKRFTFVTPNLCHNMHDCSVATGDKWLHAHVPPLLHKGAVVIVTFDEGSGGLGGGGHVLTAMAGPHVQHGVKNRHVFSHYGLLAGLERWFGVHRLNRAARARPLPL